MRSNSHRPTKHRSKGIGAPSLAFLLRSKAAAKAQLLATALLLTALSGSFHATAQPTIPFPTKPLKLVVPFPAGGPVDLTARTIAQNLRVSLGQPVVIDNRPGAATIIGTDIVAKSAPDGYTWLISTNGIAINPSIYKKLPYDTLADLVPVTLILTTPYILTAHPSLPVRTVADLVKIAKARPGELFYSSSGVGSGNHLSSALLDLLAGISTTHVPYKGSVPSLSAVVAGEVHLQFGNPISSIPLVRAGKLRALGASGSRRLPSMPELPTIAESGVPGYESVSWFGLFTTAGTPSTIVKQMQGEVARVLALPDVRRTLPADGGEIVGSSPEQFATFMKAELSKWAKIVQLAGVTAE